MSIEIVRIEAGNSSLLTHIAEDVFDHDVDPARLAAYCATPLAVLFVAVADGVVVGQARGCVHRHPDAPDEFYVDNLGVTRLWQRQGIATRLMQALLAEARTRGCDEFWLGTEADNEAAIGFYRSLGLIESDIRMFANFED